MEAFRNRQPSDTGIIQIDQAIWNSFPDVPTDDVVRQNVSAPPMAVASAQDTLEVISSQHFPPSYALGIAGMHRLEVPPILTQPYSPPMTNTIGTVPSAPSETFAALCEAPKIMASELLPAGMAVWPRLDSLRAQVLEAKHLAYGDAVITSEVPVLSRQNVRHANAMCNGLEQLFKIATQPSTDGEAIAAVETLADLADDSQIIAETILSTLMMHLDAMAGLMQRSDTLGSALEFIARLSTGIGSACLPDLLALVETLDRDFTFLVKKACDPAHAAAALLLLCVLSDATPQTRLAISQALANGWQNLRFAVVKPLTLPWVTQLLQAAIEDGVIPAAEGRLLLRGRVAIEEKPSAPLQVAVEKETKTAEEIKIAPVSVTLSMSEVARLMVQFKAAMWEQDLVTALLCIEKGLAIDTVAPMGFTYEIQGKNRTYRTTMSTTVLGLAAFLGNHDVVDRLIKQGAKVTSNSLDGAIALHLAHSMNPITWKMAIKIIKAGGHANIVWGRSHKTLLRSAVKTECVWAIKELLTLGANVNFVNKNGKTALDAVPCTGIFRRVPNQEIVAILRGAGGKTAKELAQPKAELGYWASK